ncbi:hypothetical protein BDZ91DRAFT_723799 [Kalaharituber pfeilii]|nr:hypothetical protein BDZ91DRAFT_723799 [Kalaharituber pfeilii]
MYCYPFFLSSQRASPLSTFLLPQAPHQVQVFSQTWTMMVWLVHAWAIAPTKFAFGMTYIMSYQPDC